MIGPGTGVWVYLACGVTDMRKGISGIDPQAWLADVIARISDMPVSRLHELLPWEWNAEKPQVKAA